MKKLVLAILFLVTLISLVACAPENETTSRPTPAPPRVDGLFDADGNRLASWDALVNEYGFDMKNEDDKESSQLAQIIERNEEALGTAVKLVVGDGVTSIGKSAFSGCKNLVSVDLPQSVKTIDDFAFSLCTSLENVNIPNRLTSIGEAAFEQCKISSVILPESVTSIGDAAFSACSELTTVGIPDGVTSIGYSVFSSCFNLTSIELPTSVMTLGVAAFSNCPMLDTVVLRSPMVLPCDLSTFEDCPQISSICVPAELVESYKTASVWSDYANIIKPIQ